MSENILNEHSNLLDKLSGDLTKLLQIREEYNETTEKLIAKKLSNETALIKSIETQMQNIVQRTKNWPKSVMMKSPYNQSVSITTVIHCKKCLGKVSVSRSTQTLPSFIQMTRRSNTPQPRSPKLLRGILRKPIIDGKCKTNTIKDIKETKNVIKPKEKIVKKEPLIEWSAMEWNGKNEIDEINQKLKNLNDRIEDCVGNAKTDVSTLGWKGIQPSVTSALERRLNQLEEDILYLDSGA